MCIDDVDLLSEEYEAVDHRLKLFLDVEVFEEEEELHSFLKVCRSKSTQVLKLQQLQKQKSKLQE